jgi:hypothetical protein
MTPRVALAKDARAMRAAVERAVKEAVDFPKAEGLVAGHRLAPRIMVGCAKIRGLPARGNRSMSRGEKLRPAQPGNEGMAEG